LFYEPESSASQSTIHYCDDVAAIPEKHNWERHGFSNSAILKEYFENACGLLQTRVGTYPIGDPLRLEKHR